MIKHTIIKIMLMFEKLYILNQKKKPSFITDIIHNESF